MEGEVAEEVRIFLLESFEGLDQLEQDLVTLEKQPGDKSLVNGIFRVVHTIKGNSGFLGFSKLEKLCHRGESLLDAVRSERIRLNNQVSEALFQLLDVTRTALTEIEELGREGEVDSTKVVSSLESIISNAKQ